jgi:DNA-binding CsgD family transcriptional regulator
MENGDRLARLTEREKVCLRQWLQHKSAKEIAADLHISHHAVEKRLKMARIKVGATSSLEAARMLSEAEGYGQTVAHTPDLASYALPIQAAFTRPLIFGAIAMSVIGAAVLALVMQPTGDTLSATETGILAREYDTQLNFAVTALMGSAEIDPDGKVWIIDGPRDQRFLEPNSGLYWQIAGDGQIFRSRSLWDRTLKLSGRTAWLEPLYYNSDQFPNEALRIAERTTRLPGSDVVWQFVVARSRDELDQTTLTEQ